MKKFIPAVFQKRGPAKVKGPRKPKWSKTTKLERSDGPDARGHDLSLQEARKLTEQLWHDGNTQELMATEDVVLRGYVFKKPNRNYCFIVSNEESAVEYAKHFGLTMQWTYNGMLWQPI